MVKARPGEGTSHRLCAPIQRGGSSKFITSGCNPELGEQDWFWGATAPHPQGCAMCVLPTQPVLALWSCAGRKSRQQSSRRVLWWVLSPMHGDPTGISSLTPVAQSQQARGIGPQAQGGAEGSHGDDANALISARHLHLGKLSRVSRVTGRGGPCQFGKQHPWARCCSGGVVPMRGPFLCLQ